MSRALFDPSDHEVGSAQQSRNPPSNGSGIYMLVSEEILRVWLRYMKKLPKCVCFPLSVGYDGGWNCDLAIVVFWKFRVT